MSVFLTSKTGPEASHLRGLIGEETGRTSDVGTANLRFYEDEIRSVEGPGARRGGPRSSSRARAASTLLPSLDSLAILSSLSICILKARLSVKHTRPRMTVKATPHEVGHHVSGCT